MNLYLILSVVVCAWASCRGDTLYAQCQMRPNIVVDDRKGNEISGTIDLRQIDGGMTELKINLTGFNTDDGISTHGFHVHELGDFSAPEGCSAMSGHYNPLGVDHGASTDMPLMRHVGDLGNIEETGGSAMIYKELQDYMLQLSGTYSIIGRGIIVHEHADDLGLGGSDDSLTTGNAGSRVACCVIGTTDGSHWES